ETVAVQAHDAVLDPAEAPITQQAQWLGETLADIHSEFLQEIIAAGLAQLELENELADQPLVGGGCQRAVHRPLARLDGVDVWLEIVVVLVMRSLQMAEGSDAQADQVGPRPQPVAVKK